MTRCGEFAFDPQITDGLTGIAWVKALERMMDSAHIYPNEDQIAEHAMEAVLEVRRALPNLIKRDKIDMASDVYEALLGLRDAHLMMIEPEGHA